MTQEEINKLVQAIKAGEFTAPEKPTNALVSRKQTDQILGAESHITVVGKDEEGNYVAKELKEALLDLIDAEGADDNVFVVYQADEAKRNADLEIKIIGYHPKSDSFEIAGPYELTYDVKDLDPQYSYEYTKISGRLFEVETEKEELIGRQFRVLAQVADTNGFDVYINGNKADGKTWSVIDTWGIPNAGQAVVMIEFDADNIPPSGAALTFDAHGLNLSPALYNKAKDNSKATALKCGQQRNEFLNEIAKSKKDASELSKKYATSIEEAKVSIAESEVSFKEAKKSIAEASNDNERETGLNDALEAQGNRKSWATEEINITGSKLSLDTGVASMTDNQASIDQSNAQYQEDSVKFQKEMIEYRDNLAKALFPEDVSEDEDGGDDVGPM